MSERVLVTGGAGFIGGHLSQRLIDRGYDVRVLDNLSFGKREWVPAKAEFIEGDIRDIDTCHKVSQGVVGMFHCAAMSRSGPSMDAIDTCTQQNVVGTQNVLIAARDAKLRKLVYSGSSTFYGSQPAPHHEGTPPDFLNFYGLSKAVGEQYCLLFNRIYDFPTVVLRYFNVYGPRQPQVGAYALVLGIFLRNWMDGKTLEIHGGGDQRRDFIHVHDIADANIAAFESDVRGETFNVGSGTNISIKALADLITPDQVIMPRRAGDAMETLADISHIRAKLGWEPKVTFADGLHQMMELMKKGEA